MIISKILFNGTLIQDTKLIFKDNVIVRDEESIGPVLIEIKFEK